MEGTHSVVSLVTDLWRAEHAMNRCALSPWLLDCMELEFEENACGMHEACACVCGRCYQLTWL